MSLRALAKAMGRSHVAVQKWARSPGWPFGQTGPWDVRAVLAWAQVSLHPDRSAGGTDAGAGRGGRVGDLPPLLQAELQLKIYRARFLDLQTQELKGRLHDAEECRRRRLGLIQGAKARLLDLARSAATDLVGQDRETIERVLDERIRRILEEWARGDGQTIETSDAVAATETEGAAAAGDGAGAGS